MSPTRRCIPRPPAPRLPDGAAEPGPVPAKAIPATGLLVEGVTAPNGTELPAMAPVVREEAACLVIADTPVDGWLSLRTGAVEVGGESGSVLAPVDGAVTVVCPGRLVNFRGSERELDVDVEGDVGAGVLGSTVLESVSWRWIKL